MRSLLNSMKNALRRAPLTPLRFPTTGHPIVDDAHFLEEEQFDEFQAGLYYPVNIGHIYASRYQVLGKMGFGTTSTLWLARNLHERTYVTLKIFRRGVDRDELDIALETFTLESGQGSHHCLVQRPMWDSWRDMLRWNPAHRFTESLLKVGLAQLFLALDYLDSECRLVHTDLKADNILQELVDQSVLQAFTNAELESPSPRKYVGEATVYASRQFDLPRDFGDVVLSDFGSAVEGDGKRNHDAQPNVYRSPEVMVMTEWSYPVNIWNVGAMIWDLYGGRHLFYGNDSHKGKYTTRAHLAEVVATLGPPPLDLLQKGRRSMEFFTEQGGWKAGVSLPQDLSLEGSVTRLEGKKKEEFFEWVW